MVNATKTKPELLLEVKDLQTHFFTDEGVVRAVDGVSYNIYRGRTVGIVGESGCGKSVTAQSVLRITPTSGKIVGGEILYHRRPKAESAQGRDDAEIIDLTALDPERQADSRHPRRRDRLHLSGTDEHPQPGTHHRASDHRDDPPASEGDEGRGTRARDCGAGRVGLPKPRELVDRFAHQMSGGQRQRAVIALALCLPAEPADR